MVDTRCRILELPVELRLQIYEYAVLNARVITVGTAKLDGAAPDILYRKYGANRSPIKGIPCNSEPVVETRFNAELLSNKATIELTSSTPDPIHISPQTTYQSLILVNQQINDELESLFTVPVHRQTSLFVNYPHGLHVLQTTTPELMRQSRSVHLAGLYFPPDYTPPQSYPSRRSRHFHNRDPVQPKLPKLEGEVTSDAFGQLSRFVESMFGPHAPNPVEVLELRIYFPGDSYSTVWKADSPVAVALSNIATGMVDIVVYRGRDGNGGLRSHSVCISRLILITN